MDEKSAQVNLLNNQIKSLEASNKKIANDAAKQAELVQLKTWVDGLDKERLVAKNEITKLAQVREPQIDKAAVTAAAGSAPEI